MKMKTLNDLLIHEVKDLYNAEKQLTKALPKMAKAATNEELRQAFEAHLEETKKQIERLEEVFGLLEIPVRGVSCEAMIGLIEEGKKIIEEDAEDVVRDAGLIAAAQKVEHYEIAGYGCARTFAEMCGMHKAAELLQQTLDEEKATDEKLTQIAMQSVNSMAETE